jgi:polyhydroxybutyrate depolymerase
MRSPAAAVSWELHHRHCWGLAAVIFYLVVLAGIRLLFFGPGHRVPYDGEPSFALAVIVPLGSTFMWFLGVFSFGFEGDLAARQSVYPARMFTLPVSNTALAGWPMLYGSVAMAVLWLAARLLAVWPSGVYVPLVWPALAGAAFLAWTQVLTWMPYPLAGLRVIATIVWLTVIAIVVTVALENEVSEPLMLALLAPQIPLAYLAARLAVARARRGDTPDWRGAFARRHRIRNLLASRRGEFASPADAQAWFEWQRHGLSLPALVAILLVFELALLFVFRDNPVLAFETLVAVLLTPPSMAAFVAATVSRSSPDGSDSYELAPFLATRPLSSAVLVAAKLKTTIRSTLVTWALVLAAVLLALWISGTSDVVVDHALRVIEAAGMPRAVAGSLLALSALIVLTWKQLVRSLYIGMSGRAWLVKASVFVTLSLLTLVVALVPWVVSHGEAFAAIWRSLPWILVILVCLKLWAAGWIASRLYDERLLSERALVAGAACWLIVVLALYRTLVWLVDFPPSMPRYFLGLLAILAVPWVRLSAAPLALASNRHRGVSRDRVGKSVTAIRRKQRIVASVVMLIGFPVALVLVETASFHFRERSNGVFVSSGEEREYSLYVPLSYDANQPTPLVISMHGGAMWPAQQMTMSGWNQLAEQNGFIVVYPAGTRFPRRWETFTPGPDLERDVQFISELIVTLESNYNIDPRRIYANGLSNGGGMAFVLSCALSDRIAAVGLVAPAQTLPPDWCANPRPVPMIAFQGDADRFVSYGGGPMADPINPDPPVFPATRAWVREWAQRNRCAPDPAESRTAPDVGRLEYTECADHAAVVLYTIYGGGHTWPGGEPIPEWFAGPTSRGVDATAEMWAFFRAHPLPE